MLGHQPPSRRRKVLLASALLLVGFPLAATAAHASNIPVTSTADVGPGSLRDAIAQANLSAGPDQISIPPGTYSVDSVINITDDVQVVGTGGAAVTTIDGNDTDRLFTATNGSGLTIQGLTIQEFH